MTFEDIIKQEKDKNKFMNNITFLDYYYRLKMLATSIFVWKNVPNIINVNYLENVLFENGKILFFKDENLGYLCLKFVNSSLLNIYNEPICYDVYANNYTKTGIKKEDGIIIKNNAMCIPTDSTIMLFAKRLESIQRTIETNLENLKIPYIVKTDPKQKTSLLNAIQQKKENIPVIFTDKNFDLDGIQILETPSQNYVNDLIVAKHEVFNEALSFLGINNANTDKKERLITDEVTSNNQQIEMSKESMLLTRQQACNQINERFGLNMSVEINEKLLGGVEYVDTVFKSDMQTSDE